MTILTHTHRVTEAHLDAAQDRRTSNHPLTDRVLAKMLAEGTLEGPFRPTRPIRRGAAKRAFHALREACRSTWA